MVSSVLPVTLHPFPSGLSVDREDGRTYVTVGQDAQLKLWSLPDVVAGDLSEPIHSIPLTDVPHAVSHVADSSDFATSGDGICVWKVYRLVASFRFLHALLRSGTRLSASTISARTA